MSATKVNGDLRITGEILVPNESASRAMEIDATGKAKASATTSAELGHLSGVTSAIQTQLNTGSTGLSDHLSDAVDAHDASAISSIPSGNLAATEVQAALNELQSDVDSRALDSVVIKKNGSVAFTADQSMGGFKLTNVATPVSAADAVPKSYADALFNGRDDKDSVRAASVANVVIASALENGDVVDGVTLATGDRVLLKDQTAGAENGIYVVVASGAASRSSDADISAEVTSGMFVFVEEGTVNADSGFSLITNNPIVLDTTALVFTQITGAGQIIAGAALTKSGNTLDVAVDGQGIEIVGDQLSIELDGATLAKSASGLKLSDTAVTPASIGSASQSLSITVNQQGRLTAASAQSIAITASQVSDFNEAAQDAVGGILTDTASVDFTYNDAGNLITADVLPAGVNHDALLNFVANKHVDHSAVSILTGANSGLAGGGDLTASRSPVIDASNLPSVVAADNADTVILYDNSGAVTGKQSRSVFLSGISVSSTGDINETSFAAANNQAAAANVTGLAFASGVVRSAKALVSVHLDATTDLFEVFELLIIQKGASYDMAVTGTGDNSGVIFTITSAGQVQYQSNNSAGFVSNTIKFRAIVTGV